MGTQRLDLAVGHDVGPTSMRRAATAMFLLGAAASCLGVWTTDQEVGTRLVEAGVALGLATLGAWTYLGRLGRGAIELTAMTAMVLIGVLVAVGEPLSAAPFFLLWPVALIAYFSSRRRLAVGGGVALAALAGGLWLHSPSPIKVDMFMATAISVGLLGWLISSMTRYQGALRAELALAAETDPLTGVLNRRAFHPRLERMVDRCSADHTALTLVMFDLDHFKRINDTYGHLAGDAVLEHFGAALRAESRTADLVARLGGEEFAVALPGAGHDEADRFARRVAARLVQVPGIDQPVGTCAGICALSAGSGSADALLRHADQALYAAKVAGRGRPAVWSRTVTVGEPFLAEELEPGSDPAPCPG